MNHEFLPCHMRHPYPYAETDCLYGHCLSCHNHHCAFDTCIPEAIGAAIDPTGEMMVQLILKPGNPEYERARRSVSIN